MSFMFLSAFQNQERHVPEKVRIPVKLDGDSVADWWCPVKGDASVKK